MPPRFQKLKEQFILLSKVDKVFLIVLFLRLVYPLIAAATGIRMPGYGLVRFAFIAASLVFLVRSFPRLARSLLWRVRHRLLVTWVLVGVVPIVLICLLVGQGLFILMGQLVSYMTASEIARQGELVRSSAQALAWSVAHRGQSATVPSLTEAFVRDMPATQQGEAGAIVRSGGTVTAVPHTRDIQEIPAWSKPGFVGLLNNEGRYYLGAYVALEDSPEKTEVFLYRPTPDDFFKSLLPDVATVLPGRGTVSRAGLDISTTKKPRSAFSVRYPNPGDQENPDEDPDIADPPPPAGRGWWDIPISWLVLMPASDVATGKNDNENAAIVSSRPSLILNRLFSTFGSLGTAALIFMIVTALVLLVVEIVAALFGAKLTRSITRAVADLYEGTRRVQAGDFSHRIPVRTKDQLSELAGSFNNMTERIQHLIVEVKEKERLENELTIARDVQAQLFPKEFPRLKTLEMFGSCLPARMVSGDYYDFVSLGADRAALAIGDISGKGISAALLMAHIQSALRSQLMHSKSGENGAKLVMSPAGILTILNDHLYTSSAPEKYATFFLGLYADEAGQLIYTNAGHLAPMLVRGKQVLRLPGDGFPVGLFPGAQYEQQVLSLQAGDLLVGFTDGVTETPNRDGEEFGDGRLTELLLRHGDKSLERIADEIGASVAAWAGDAERHDDTTLVFARRV